jgi:hypothetical protein
VAYSIEEETSMTVREYAQLYNTSQRTIKRYKAQGLPLDDLEAMRELIAAKRSRLGVSKLCRRADTQDNAEDAPIAPIAAEVLPPCAPVKAILNAPDPGTLARLVEAEKIAYQRYIDTGGSERAAQTWLLTCDQKRKLEETAAKIQNDVSEADSKFMNACLEVIGSLALHLDAVPKTAGVLCEGLSRFEIETKLKDYLLRVVADAIHGILLVVKGTPLETVFFNAIEYNPNLSN